MEAFNEGYVTSLIKEIEQMGCRCGTFFGCGIHSLCNSLRFTIFPKVELPYIPPEKVFDSKRSCNLHDDCNEADRKGIIKCGQSYNQYTAHCHDDCCEECFGN
jgi:hypothetical protein